MKTETIQDGLLPFMCLIKPLNNPSTPLVMAAQKKITQKQKKVTAKNP